ncbi:MAG: protein kinase domain-containing protein [Thermoanaerobaculia bacterium]
MTLASGSRLGPYEVLAPLGAGGMGEVYRARDTRLGREVAVKVLPAEFSADPARLRRFEQEARAASALNHPNILTIHDVGTHGGVPYVVTELLEGETLRGGLAAGALPPKRALGHALQIAHGLAAAHEKGIVHRDLKPENIFVTRDGRLKILDFGLARLVSAGQSEVVRTELPTESPGTDPGVVLGTLGYMSPEQLRGQPADARSDIFSFGAILYEMLSGRRAFRGSSAADTIGAILKEEPPELSGTHRGISPGLERVVRHCLEKDPEQRFRSAHDLAFDLEALSDGLAVAPAGRPARAARRRWMGVAAAVGLLLLIAAVVVRLRPRSGAIDSLAVLPFVNESADPETEYLGDGITESLINSLSQLPNLRVVSRSSVFRYKGKNSDPAAVARELGVRAVVTGRVMQRGGMLSIGAELVDTRGNRQLWGEQYNRKFADVLAIQEEIARQISENLRLRLTGEEQARLTKRATANPEAYQAYLKGFHHARKYTREDVSKGMEYFRQALALDPNYAPAYAGLAYIYVSGLADWYAPAKEVFPQAKEAALKAVELDPSLAEAHTFLAVAKLLYDYDWAGSEQEFRRALESNPADASTHYWYGVYLVALGRFEAGMQEIKRALELDPLSLEINNSLGMLFYYWRRYDEAIEQLRRTLELDSSYFFADMVLGQVYEQKGEFRAAAAAFERARWVSAEAGESPPEILAGLIRSDALAGNRAAAMKRLEELKRLMTQRYVSRHDLAVASLALGEKEQALDWLEKAYEDRNWWMPFLKVDPRFDALRSEPRFQALLRRIGLPP